MEAPGRDEVNSGAAYRGGAAERVAVVTIVASSGLVEEVEEEEGVLGKDAASCEKILADAFLVLMF